MIRRVLDSPIGPLTLGAGPDGLRELTFGARAGLTPGRSAVLDAAAEQLAEYFAGARRRFELALDPVGTAFQLEAWHALTAIPYGATATYGEQARRIGRPRAVRAVGAANGRNPLALVLPCHRVVGADGSLTGFGGGLEVKRALLDLEAGDQLRLAVGS